VMPCGSCKNWHSSETSVLTRATWCHIPKDGILHSHSLNENLKYIPIIHLEWRSLWHSWWHLPVQGGGG
jgi:hypothetical protein